MPSPEVSINRKSLFLRACRLEPVERVPVWIMRQAGRYLPDYRALRARHSFLEVCKTPDLAAEVSLQPFRQIGVDAVIVFSDILIVAEAMGQPLEIGEGAPVLGNPVRDRAAIASLRDFDPDRETKFVGDAIRAIAREVGPDVPVLGFAAAPWTLACYMIEGQARGDCVAAKQMMYSEPHLLRDLLEKLAHATARYLKSQIAAGAAAVQLFDTWAGELAQRGIRRVRIACDTIGDRPTRSGANTGDPLHQGRRPICWAAWRELARTVLSVDWRIDLAEARRTLKYKVGLQGNIDPIVLLSGEENARQAARAAIEKTQGIGHILNLGHGILPSTPVENARAFVEAGQSVAIPARATIGQP